MKARFSAVLLFVMLLLSSFPLLAQEAQEIPDNFPEITIDVATDPAPGYLYIANFKRNDAEDTENGNYVAVIDNEGTPLFYEDLSPARGYNLGRTPDGNLYYYRLADFGPGFGASMDGTYIITDEQGEVIRTYEIPDGRTQAHEFIIRENGNVVITSQPAHPEDLTEYGGFEDGNLVEAVIQEYDPDGNLVFEWQSWDHFDPSDTAAENFLEAEPPTAVPYIHMNGIAIDLEGNYIISARRFDELIKIDGETGEVIWHMGGGQSKHNEFEFINDPFNGFSGQHHPSVLPNGNILLFDNGNRHEEQVSRVVEYEIDEENRTATLVWSYTDGRFTATMGSVQRLPNGNTLVGHGSAAPTGPSVTEVSPDGEVVFALSFPETQIHYRVYRLPFGDETE